MLGYLKDPLREVEQPYFHQEEVRDSHPKYTQSLISSLDPFEICGSKEDRSSCPTMFLLLTRCFGATDGETLQEELYGF